MKPMAGADKTQYVAYTDTDDGIGIIGMILHADSGKENQALTAEKQIQ
jgi:hypothetical protein